MNFWTFITLFITFFVIFLLLLFPDRVKIGCSRIFRIRRKITGKEEPEDYGFKL